MKWAYLILSETATCRYESRDPAVIGWKEAAMEYVDGWPADLGYTHRFYNTVLPLHCFYHDEKPNFVVVEATRLHYTPADAFIKHLGP